MNLRLTFDELQALKSIGYKVSDETLERRAKLSHDNPCELIGNYRTVRLNSLPY